MIVNGCLFTLTHTFSRSAYLTDIVHNNHDISRHRYNYSTGALLYYLDISDKYLLVNIIQAFCYFSKDFLNACMIDMPGKLTASFHTSILSGQYWPAISLKAAINGSTSTTI